MDYETKPTSRERLRIYSKFLRVLFDIPATGKFPVLQVLDKLSDVFEGTTYELSLIHI